ncbi:hypothetical protein [Bradyrhizobium guangxiense]|uniref:hypothetical protein n=1 Tax=Bradyrhizobium guangxiense TaxID=1325115 RepID=UPI0013E8A342|nr:hypothetical protein [Bradyrhizobium guangxiense]
MSIEDEIEHLFWGAIETFPQDKRDAAKNWLAQRISAFETIDAAQTDELRASILPDGEE